MSKELYDRKALIQYRLERAHESLNDAQLMLEQNGSPAGVINRAYYAMFYTTLALLITIDKGSFKHQGVIALFDENFINKTSCLKSWARCCIALLKCVKLGIIVI